MLTWLRARLGAGERGMATAEYAIGTLAAVAFAMLLYRIATSPQIVSDMANIFNMAFRMASPLPGAATSGH